MKPTQSALIGKLRDLAPRERLAIARECAEMARQEDLQIGGRAIPFFTVPLMLEQSTLSPVSKRLGSFLEALIRIEEYALGSAGGDVLERLMASLTAGGRHLVEQCTFESPSSLRRRMRRFVGFLEAGSGAYSLIEVNQAAPLAIHYHDAGQRIAAFVMQRLGFSLSPRLLAPHVLEWMLDEYRDRYAGQLPDTIALVIEHGYPPKLTDLPRMARACEKIAMERYGHRLSFVTCFPYEIRLRGAEIYCQERKVDMIWRNSVYMTAYREEGLDIEDYERICGSPDRYLIINSTRSWLTRTKEVFSLVWDDEVMKEIGFRTAEIEGLRTVVPLSINLRRRGQQWSEEIIGSREQWISKPTDSGFGKGVEFGESHSREDWASLVRERTVDGFVFQKKIPYPALESLDIDAEGALVSRSIEYDFCPHHVNGVLTGTALVRATIMSPGADTQTMNLASGGLLYPLIIEEQAH